MWRFFNSFTRGARTFRPNPCCSQESSDESGCNFYNNDCQSTNSSCIVVPSRCYSAASSEKNKNNVTLRLCRISCCLCHHLVRGVCTDVKKTHEHRKIVWVIPCDVYPHADHRWSHRKSRESSHFNWSQFYQEQQSILNALGWGSLTALAWMLSQDLRNIYFLSYPPNKKPISDSQDLSVRIYDYDTVHQNREDSSSGECSKDTKNPLEENFSFLRQYPIRRQNADQSACFQPNLFNPEVNKSFFASLFANAVQINVNISESSGLYLASEVEAVGFHIDRRPQIDTDRQLLEKEKVSEDSGYSEKVQEKSSSPGSIHDECSLCSQETYSCISETPVAEQEEIVACPDVDESSHHIVVGLAQQCSNKVPSENFGQDVTPTSVSNQEKVLIEDCSSCDILQNDKLSSSKDTTSETNVSSKKHGSAAAGIEEFSDGLKEILEAGRKDLNEFNTQFMGVLEGDIGRSVSKDEPNLAVAYFRAGSLLGDPSSTYNLGLCYHLARGVEQDLKMARELYEAAALVGHGWAMYNLAVLMLEGQGGPADHKRAHDLLTEAEKLGVREAQVALKQIKELQKEHHPKDMDVSSNAIQDQRQSLSNSHSEPTLSSVLSGVWSSSYSTTDLDFMDDSCEQQMLDLSSMKMEYANKPKFYLE